MMSGLAKRGAAVELVSHASERRFPLEQEDALRAAGVQVGRLGNGEGWPMHDKFVLVEDADDRWASFGSFNFNEQSRHLNHEIGAITRDAAICSALEARWSQLR